MASRTSQVPTPNRGSNSSNEKIYPKKMHSIELSEIDSTPQTNIFQVQLSMNQSDNASNFNTSVLSNRNNHLENNTNRNSKLRKLGSTISYKESEPDREEVKKNEQNKIRKLQKMMSIKDTQRWQKSFRQVLKNDSPSKIQQQTQQDEGVKLSIPEIKNEHDHLDCSPRQRLKNGQEEEKIYKQVARQFVQEILKEIKYSPHTDALLLNFLLTAQKGIDCENKEEAEDYQFLNNDQSNDKGWKLIYDGMYKRSLQRFLRGKTQSQQDQNDIRKHTMYNQCSQKYQSERNNDLMRFFKQNTTEDKKRSKDSRNNYKPHIKSSQQQSRQVSFIPPGNIQTSKKEQDAKQKKPSQSYQTKSPNELTKHNPIQNVKLCKLKDNKFGQQSSLEELDASAQKKRLPKYTSLNSMIQETSLRSSLFDKFMALTIKEISKELAMKNDENQQSVDNLSQSISQELQQALKKNQENTQMLKQEQLLRHTSPLNTYLHDGGKVPSHARLILNNTTDSDRGFQLPTGNKATQFYAIMNQVRQELQTPSMASSSPKPKQPVNKIISETEEEHGYKTQRTKDIPTLQLNDQSVVNEFPTTARSGESALKSSVINSRQNEAVQIHQDLIQQERQLASKLDRLEKDQISRKRTQQHQANQSSVGKTMDVSVFDNQFDTSCISWTNSKESTIDLNVNADSMLNNTNPHLDLLQQLKNFKKEYKKQRSPIRIKNKSPTGRNQQHDEMNSSCIKSPPNLLPVPLQMIKHKIMTVNSTRAGKRIKRNPVDQHYQTLNDFADRPKTTIKPNNPNINAIMIEQQSQGIRQDQAIRAIHTAAFTDNNSSRVVSPFSCIVDIKTNNLQPIKIKNSKHINHHTYGENSSIREGGSIDQFEEKPKIKKIVKPKFVQQKRYKSVTLNKPSYIIARAKKSIQSPANTYVKQAQQQAKFIYSLPFMGYTPN